jgi:serine/tyrosine/threonine adenylyltransferase
MDLPFDNGFARLGEKFYSRVRPTRVRAPGLIRVNDALAELLGLSPEALRSEAGVEVFAGNAVPGGADPIALVYAGHQFGGFVPRLGDGRAILLGEIVGRDGKRRDVQLKGAGPTPYSRRGDGRAALGPVLREYLVSEAMAALGIPTTRALAAVTTGEPVVRDELLPGAVFTRVAASHLRIGTFQYFASQGDVTSLTTLAEYALRRHYPDAPTEEPALTLLDCVVGAQAALVARWLGVGFIHGVMNTDNTSISGETIDYGPCAFLDEYRPDKKFSSIDVGKRYAFANQPRILLWNLYRLAEALVPAMADTEDAAVKKVTSVLDTFPARFEAAHADVSRAKLGLLTEREDDATLYSDLLERMASNEVDFTRFFRSLCDVAGDASAASDAAHAVGAQFSEPGAFFDWAARWRERLTQEDEAMSAERALQRRERMRSANPAFIPRNHRVEEVIAAATRDRDLAPFEELHAVLSRPFDDQPDHARWAEPPRPTERVAATFCGT